MFVQKQSVSKNDKCIFLTASNHDGNKRCGQSRDGGRTSALLSQVGRTQQVPLTKALRTVQGEELFDNSAITRLRTG
jgi:hypothetical protein